jgi:hypothetical protein
MGSHFRSTIASISISGSREFSRPERLAAKNQLFNLPECRLEGGESLYMKRLNRLTLAFSKKLENFEAAVGLHFASYNFVEASQFPENDACNGAWNREGLLDVW